MLRGGKTAATSDQEFRYKDKTVYEKCSKFRRNASPLEFSLDEFFVRFPAALQKRRNFQSNPSDPSCRRASSERAARLPGDFLVRNVYVDDFRTVFDKLFDSRTPEQHTVLINQCSTRQLTILSIAMYVSRRPDLLPHVVGTEVVNPS